MNFSPGKDAKKGKATSKKSKEGARRKLLDDLGSGPSSGEEEADEEKEDTDKEEDMVCSFSTTRHIMSI